MARGTVTEEQVALKGVIQAMQLEREKDQSKLQRRFVGFFPAGVEIKEGIKCSLKHEVPFVRLQVFEKSFEAGFGDFECRW